MIDLLSGLAEGLTIGLIAICTGYLRSSNMVSDVDAAKSLIGIMGYVILILIIISHFFGENSAFTFWEAAVLSLLFSYSAYPYTGSVFTDIFNQDKSFYDRDVIGLEKFVIHRTLLKSLPYFLAIVFLWDKIHWAPAVFIPCGMWALVRIFDYCYSLAVMTHSRSGEVSTAHMIEAITYPEKSDKEIFSTLRPEFHAIHLKYNIFRLGTVMGSVLTIVKASTL